MALKSAAPSTLAGKTFFLRVPKVLKMMMMTIIRDNQGFQM